MTMASGATVKDDCDENSGDGDDDDDDVWGVFGDEDDDDDDDSDEGNDGNLGQETNLSTASKRNGNKQEEAIRTDVGLSLLQTFLKGNAQIPIQRRIVHCNDDEGKNGCYGWSVTFRQRGMKTVDVLKDPTQDCYWVDAAVIPLDDHQDQDNTNKNSSVGSNNGAIRKRVVPGGWLIVDGFRTFDNGAAARRVLETLDRRVWRVNNTRTYQRSDPDGKLISAVLVQKAATTINQKACPWKKNTLTAANERERDLLRETTVVRAACEMNESSSLTDNATQRAVNALHQHGYCIVKGLLDKDKCKKWGEAVLHDLDRAASKLLTEDGVDLRHPHESKNNPDSYRELAMREDLRMDLRDGPSIRKLRQEEIQDCGLSETITDLHSPVLIRNLEKDTSPQSCLRFHTDVLKIVQRALNPTDAGLFRGNFGRYNFDGTGPDGSPQPLRVGPMGGLVSLPRAADQAIHADTPHLFETYDCLPPHYVNVFTPGRDDPNTVVDVDGTKAGSTTMGGTAFVHGSHRLSFCANFQDGGDDDFGTGSVANQPNVQEHLVRPSLELGDVLMFDCRILHFGLANTSTTERPVLYTNITQGWFHDPKNWDLQKPIFSDDDDYAR